MNDELKLTSHAALIKSLTTKLTTPSFYTQTVVSNIKEQLQTLKKERTVVDKQRRELQIEIQNLLTREPYLVNENQELTTRIDKWQTELDQVMIDLISPPQNIKDHDLNRYQIEKKHLIQELKGNIDHAELRIAEVNTELNLRKIKEVRLNNLGSKIRMIETKHQALTDDLNQATSELDLIHDPIGRDLYLSDYEKLYGINATNQLRKQIQEAAIAEQPMIVTDNGLVTIDREEVALEEPIDELSNINNDVEDIKLNDESAVTPSPEVVLPNEQALPIPVVNNNNDSLEEGVAMDIKEAPAGLVANVWQSLKNTSKVTRIIILMAALTMPGSLLGLATVGMVGASLLAKPDEERSR